MFTVYLISLIVGGGLVGVSVLFGGDSDTDHDASFDADHDVDLSADHDVDLSADHDVDMDHDIDVDAGADLEVEADHGGEMVIHEGSAITEGASSSDVALGFWLILSVRFWTFFLAFFGLTGTLLTFLMASQLWIGLISGGLGLFAGAGVSYTIRALQQKTVSSGVTPQEFIGQTAKVVLPVSPQRPGKIRLYIRESDVDMIAQTDEERTLERGDEVFIIAIKNGVAQVVKRFKELKD